MYRSAYPQFRKAIGNSFQSVTSFAPPAQPFHPQCFQELAMQKLFLSFVLSKRRAQGRKLGDAYITKATCPLAEQVSQLNWSFRPFFLSCLGNFGFPFVSRQRHCTYMYSLKLAFATI